MAGRGSSISSAISGIGVAGESSIATSGGPALKCVQIGFCCTPTLVGGALWHVVGDSRCHLFSCP